MHLCFVIKLILDLLNTLEYFSFLLFLPPHCDFHNDYLNVLVHFPTTSWKKIILHVT